MEHPLGHPGPAAQRLPGPQLLLRMITSRSHPRAGSRQDSLSVELSPDANREGGWLLGEAPRGAAGI